jgi:CBS domain-containing protein
MNNEKPNGKKAALDSQLIDSTLRHASKTQFGVLDTGFLNQNISILANENPICVSEDESLAETMNFLKTNKIGCVLIVNQDDRLSGIFTERDYMLKIFGNKIDLSKTRVSEYMTNAPVSLSPDSHIAYALNLMSQLGFRHLPVIDNDNIPISVISVRDIMDYIVQSFVDDLLGIKLPKL